VLLLLLSQSPKEHLLLQTLSPLFSLLLLLLLLLLTSLSTLTLLQPKSCLMLLPIDICPCLSLFSFLFLCLS